MPQWFKVLFFIAVKEVKHIKELDAALDELIKAKTNINKNTKSGKATLKNIDNAMNLIVAYQDEIIRLYNMRKGLRK